MNTPTNANRDPTIPRFSNLAEQKNYPDYEMQNQAPTQNQPTHQPTHNAYQPQMNNYYQSPQTHGNAQHFAPNPHNMPNAQNMYQPQANHMPNAYNAHQPQANRMPNAQNMYQPQANNMHQQHMAHPQANAFNNAPASNYGNTHQQFPVAHNNAQPQYNAYSPNINPNPNYQNNNNPHVANLPNKAFYEQKNQMHVELNDDGPSFSFKDERVRLQFIRKVYLILTFQLTVTASFICLGVFNDDYIPFVKAHIWTVPLAIVLSLITVYALSCYKSVARQVPLNFILLAICTLCIAYTTSISASTAQKHNVFIAAVLTVAITIGLTIYAITTKTDITMCGGVLFMLGMLLIAVSILTYFYGQTKFLMIGGGALGCLVFGLYIVYDTQLIVGGRSHELEIDDYIIGALMLFLDIINLFLQILKILEAVNRE